MRTSTTAFCAGCYAARQTSDVISAQELGFQRTEDADLLEWAALQGRVIVTHDVRTMPGFAYARVRAGQSFPGIIEVNDEAPLGQVIEDILTLIECLADDEWENLIWYVPL